MLLANKWCASLGNNEKNKIVVTTNTSWTSSLIHWLLKNKWICHYYWGLTNNGKEWGHFFKRDESALMAKLLCIFVLILIVLLKTNVIAISKSLSHLTYGNAPQARDHVIITQVFILLWLLSFIYRSTLLLCESGFLSRAYFCLVLILACLFYFVHITSCRIYFPCANVPVSVSLYAYKKSRAITIFHQKIIHRKL